jgi:hypothetical protein
VLSLASTTTNPAFARTRCDAVPEQRRGPVGVADSAQTGGKPASRAKCSRRMQSRAFAPLGRGGPGRLVSWWGGADRSRRNPDWSMRKRLATVIVLCGVAAGVAAFAWPNQRGSRVARYEYVAEVGQLSVYSIANGSVVGRFGLPGVAEIRGIDASAATGMLYVSYGGFPTGITQAGEHGDHRRASCSASRCWRRDPRRQQPNRRLRRGGPLGSSVRVGDDQIWALVGLCHGELCVSRHTGRVAPE